MKRLSVNQTAVRGWGGGGSLREKLVYFRAVVDALILSLLHIMMIIFVF